ncbi:MAG: FtsW/RodA/SpoVE family cell cycle protein [Tuberibacillus sp.]
MADQKPLSNRFDINLIFILCLLMAISLIAVYGAQVSDPSLGNKVLMQAAWFIVGIVILFPMTYFDLEQFEKLSWILYIFGILLLGFLIIAPEGIAHTANSAKSWFIIPGGLGTFQPSELMKPFLILCLARMIDRHYQDIGEEKTLKSDFKLLLKTGMITLIPIGLIMMQPDLGTSLVIIFIYFTMLIVSRISIKILAPLFLSIAFFGSLLIYLSLYYSKLLVALGVDQYQLNRIISWLEPDKISNDQTFQVNQSLLTIGSGQFYGNGIVQTPVSLPESHTDFIFSIIAGSFGFIGGAIVVCLYFFLIYFIVMIGIRSNRAFGAYICAGVIGMITFHVFENIGMVIGMLPITGIPLPFISYGGSSVLGSMISIGLVMSVKFHTKHYMFS